MSLHAREPESHLTLDSTKSQTTTFGMRPTARIARAKGSHAQQETRDRAPPKTKKMPPTHTGTTRQNRAPPRWQSGTAERRDDRSRRRHVARGRSRHTERRGACSCSHCREPSGMGGAGCLMFPSETHCAHEGFSFCGRARENDVFAATMICGEKNVCDCGGEGGAAGQDRTGRMEFS